MGSRPILLYPDPILKRVSALVGRVDDRVRSLVRDLEDTLVSGPGTVGIAAPQIGELLRVVVVDVSSHRKPGRNHGHLILINPVITEREGSKVGREGCLSVPDFTANIRRSTRILVEARDLDDRSCTIDAQGFEAVVLQHEIDHLDGFLFLDRVASISSDLFRRKNYLPSVSGSED